MVLTACLLFCSRRILKVLLKQNGRHIPKFQSRALRRLLDVLTWCIDAARRLEVQFFSKIPKQYAQKILSLKSMKKLAYVKTEFYTLQKQLFGRARDPEKMLALFGKK